MKERIGYIDSMKGLAILLMVMGHVIACQFTSWQVALFDSPSQTMLVWKMIYSFHLPLFMFCSGLFALQITEYTWKNIGTTIWKRVMTLLVPFFVVGTIKYLTMGEPFLSYWFLWVLFWFLMIVLIIDGLCSLLPRYSQEVSTGLIVASALLVHVFYSKFCGYEQLPFWDLGHMNMYPYFCVGIICARYDLCEKWFLKNWVYTIALFLFGYLMYGLVIANIQVLPKQSITACLLPISAIVMLVYLFKEGVNEASKPLQWLQELGRHSLEIYIIHFFFLFHMPFIGDYVMKLASTGGEGRTIFFVQVTTAFIASIIIIILSYLVMNMINKSKILSPLLLGRKSENNLWLTK